MITFLEKHVSNTLRLHKAMHEHSPGSPEADGIRDELDETWCQLSDSEQVLIGDISEIINERTDEIYVLRRALAIATLNDPSPFSTAKRWIDQARRELESEGER